MLLVYWLLDSLLWTNTTQEVVWVQVGLFWLAAWKGGICHVEKDSVVTAWGGWNCIPVKKYKKMNDGAQLPFSPSPFIFIHCRILPCGMTSSSPVKTLCKPFMDQPRGISLVMLSPVMLTVKGNLHALLRGYRILSGFLIFVLIKYFWWTLFQNEDWAQK